MTISSKRQRFAELRPLYPAAARGFAKAWEVRMIYESSWLEGSTLTLRETEVGLSNDGAFPEKSEPDHLAVRSLYRAWKDLEKRALLRSEPTEADLFGAHRTLSGNDHAEGHQFVKSLSNLAANKDVIISTVEIMGDLFFELPKDSVQKACCLHHRITKLSRFQDYSGKIARLAMNFVLIADGYPPVSISPDLRDEYYAALEAADDGDFQQWLGFLTTRLDYELDLRLEALEQA